MNAKGEVESRHDEHKNSQSEGISAYRELHLVARREGREDEDTQEGSQRASEKWRSELAARIGL